jgi:spermidine/putrescine transport system ATP-binding protein
MPADTFADIAFAGVSKRYGEVLAVDRVDLEVPKGSFMSLLGPSGCGKTTSLRMMAGFEQPSSGSIFIEGQDITGTPAHRRPVNMVFQHYALFPHLNVFDNVAYGLRQRSPRIDTAEIDRRVANALDQVRLAGYDKRRTFEISGGQQQRVALARALINRPKVLLLDEPLAALDRKLRRDMQIELQNLQRSIGITFVLVTHDQEEALSMSDRVCIMRDGRIVQAGGPKELYDEPVSRYVADFVGKSNFFPGRVESREGRFARVQLAGGRTISGRLPAGASGAGVGEAVTVAVRPEVVLMSKSSDTLGAAADVTVPARIKNCIFLGEHTEYLVETEGLGDLLVLMPKRLETEDGASMPGQVVCIGWPSTAALILASE